MSVNDEVGYAISDLFNEVDKIRTPILKLLVATVSMGFLAICFALAMLTLPIVGGFKLIKRQLYSYKDANDR